MLITKIQLVIAILGSGTFSALLIFGLTWIKDWLTEKNRIEKERERELYSQLKFYLKLIKICQSTRVELMKDNERAFAERTNYIDQIQEGDLIIKNLNNLQEFVTKLIDGSWKYIESIKKLFEENTKYIKESDWPIVEKFFKEYFIREIVVGKERYKDTSHIFTFEKITEAFDAIFNVINELDNKIKV